MINTEKGHYEDTLKGYCVQEGFAVAVFAANNQRYTASVLCVIIGEYMLADWQVAVLELSGSGVMCTHHAEDLRQAILYIM